MLVYKKSIKYNLLVPIAIIIILFTLFKGINNPWNKPIGGEGIGYYSYLPAFFIYQDVSFSFLDKTGPIYYADGRGTSEECLNKFDGIAVNKYFIGVSVLMLPFFLITHVCCFLFGFPMDGYSAPYQIFVAISAWFYLWIGCIFLQKILRSFSENIKQNYWIIFVLILGTNISHIAINEPFHSHIYLFAMVNLFIYSAIRFFADTLKWKKAFYLMVFAVSMIAIIRPQDVLVILLLPFCAGNLPSLSTGLKKIFSNVGILVKGLLLWAFIICIPLIGWYLQTGHFFLNPYEGEHYYWASPQFVKQLFSYQKGWLLYTPLAAFSFLGFIHLYKKNKLQFYNLLLFFLIIIYCFSAWWSWHYASSFSQRVYVDFYGLVAILLVCLLNGIQHHQYLKIGSWILLFLFIPFNLIQNYQCLNGILPGLKTNKDIYWNKFLSFKKTAIYTFPADAILWSKNYKMDMENISPISDWKGGSMTNEQYYSGNKSCVVNASSPYSITLKVAPPIVDTTAQWHIKVEGIIKVLDDNTEAVLVLDLSRNGESLSYNSFSLRDNVRKDKWDQATFGIQLTPLTQQTDTVVAYLWNPNTTQTTYIDDFQITFLKIKKDFDVLKR